MANFTPNAPRSPSPGGSPAPRGNGQGLPGGEGDEPIEETITNTGADMNPLPAEPVPGPAVPDVTMPAPLPAPNVAAINTVTPKRRGASISAKMIVTTTLLLGVIVALFGALSVINTQTIIDDASRQKIELFEKSLGQSAIGQVRALGMSSVPLFNDSKEIDMQNAVNALAQSRNVDYAYFVYANGNVAAHSDINTYPPASADTVREYKPIADPLWPDIQKKKRTVLPPDAKNWLRTKDGKTAVFATPVFSEGVSVDGTPLGEDKGTLVVAYTLRFIEEQTAQAKIDKKNAFNKAWIRTAGIGAIFILAGLLLAIFQAMRISKPVKALAYRANQIARGDLDTRVEVTSSDEIGVLGESFNFMADQLVVLLRQTAEKATMEKELEVARTIQETLVPQEDTVDRGHIKLAGYFQPASQCGGDWWTWHELNDGRILVVIGDVTGHGVPSAMITAAAKAACDTVRAMTNDRITVTLLLEIMNRAIFESAKRKFVMTCFASIIDPKTKKISFGNAGHNFPYLYRVVNGRGEFGCLMTRGNRLGDMMESKYVEQTMDLMANDVLVWYTDGIVECENDRGEEYGEKRFRASIRRAAAEDPGQLRDTVVKASMQFFGETPRKDDITMVVARVA